MSAAEYYLASEAEAVPAEVVQSKRQKFGSFIKTGWEKGLVLGKEEALKGRILVENSLGLGPRPNVIPSGEANVNGPLRTVELGWHPVAGFGGKWFAEKTRLGQKITKEIGHHPDPTQHWAVLVGGYCHQLWMDERLHVIYINEVINRDEWHTFEVGQTRFTDEALRQTGEMVIHNMRQSRPAYNLISNNCQNFAVNMLDQVQIGSRREFATTFAIYQRATGRGSIKDLFNDSLNEQAEQEASGRSHQATVKFAQKVMHQNTTQLDNHHY
ncbi:hypothetical protein LTR64_005739 [Lithohypha guttulata]|uniref:uncharacterized protein n=1 Tax=Lithohypha guttulata TaxID=1690604 RepID=UPI002DE0CF2D|nr:hypothetical protein LTR51_002466 [Lithohypha guttulata]